MRVVSGHFSKTLNVGMSVVIFLLPLIQTFVCVKYRDDVNIRDQFVVLLSPRPVW